VSAIYFTLPASIFLAGIFLGAYIWSVRSGQYEDTQTPAMRMLTDDKTISPTANDTSDLEKNNQNEPT
jgi:cbb3-type cytochrome oxidase maturation protein